LEELIAAGSVYPEVLQIFADLGIATGDMDELADLFAILDVEGTGELNLDDFLGKIGKILK
jgi:hypothetical protein